MRLDSPRLDQHGTWCYAGAYPLMWPDHHNCDGQTCAGCEQHHRSTAHDTLGCGIATTLATVVATRVATVCTTIVATVVATMVATMVATVGAHIGAMVVATIVRI